MLGGSLLGLGGAELGWAALCWAGLGAWLGAWLGAGLGAGLGWRVGRRNKRNKPLIYSFHSLPTVMIHNTEPLPMTTV